jgi:chaperonin GroES
MALNIKPLSDRVIVEPALPKLKQHQEFLFQIQQKKTTKKGIVVAVGNGKDETQ